MRRRRWIGIVLGLWMAYLSAPVGAQPIPRATLTGRVIDAETGLPLAETNVFIANTTWGAATDSAGVYTLVNIPHGPYELVASRVGYAFAVLRINPADTTRYDLALTPRIVELGEMTVSAERPAQWRRNLKTFEALFLGTSANAKHSRIVNPEVLNFQKNEEEDLFLATAAAPLEVINEALGYRVEVVLRDFEARGQALRYTVKPRFEELTPRSNRQQRRWERAREKAYRGSLRHFLSALAHDALAEEGFELYSVAEPLMHYPKKWVGSRQYQALAAKAFEVDPDTLVKDGAVSYEKQLQFEGYLQIVFMEEDEAAQYVRDSYSWKRGIRYYQASWISLAESPVVFDVFGNLEDAYSVIQQGYLFWEFRLATMLPLDYGMDRVGDF